MHNLGMGLITCILSLFAGDSPKSETPRQQYEALLKRYDAPLSTFVNNQVLAKKSTKPFLTLARENPSDPASVDALNWVVTHTLFTPVAGEAMDMLARDHIQNEKLAVILPELTRLYGGSFEPLEKLFRAASEKSKRHDARGRGCLNLGRYLVMHKERVEFIRIQRKMFDSGLPVPFNLEPKETDQDLLRIKMEAQSLLLRVISEFSDVKGLAESAKETLAKLDKK